jgi:hypothetical protein
MSRFCWILIFDVETGKVVKIREYLNTALVKEAVEGVGIGRLIEKDYMEVGQ